MRNHVAGKIQTAQHDLHAKFDGLSEYMIRIHVMVDELWQRCSESLVKNHRPR